MRISDWSSDVCSSDLRKRAPAHESERSSAAAPAAARPDRRAAWPATGLGRRDRDSLLPPSRSGDRNGYDGCSSSARNSGQAAPDRQDRQRVVWGKSVSVRVDIGGHRIIKQQKIYDYTRQSRRVPRIDITL